MPKRSRKPRDLNRLAANLVSEATAEEPTATEPGLEPQHRKDPAAVELGRRGGLKGGKARAKKLTAAERSEAARRAAKARWGDGRT